MTPKDVFEELLNVDQRYMDKKKLASVAKAAKSFCLGLQLMNIDNFYEKPDSMLGKLN